MNSSLGSASLVQTSQQRHKQIEAHLTLVSKIVSRINFVQNGEIETEDLVGYGIIGLIESIDKYEPQKGKSFEAFATPRIRGAVYDQMRALDKLGRGSRKKVKLLSAAVQELEQELHAAPTNQQIADKMNISVKELLGIQREANIMTFSLDATVNEDSEESWVDQVSDHRPSPEQRCEENMLRENLIKAIESLPERERTVIGLYHYRKLTMKEIAANIGVSESRACQVHNRGISLLRSKLDTIYKSQNPLF
jgi:RNA polymerase sigma factor FliA